MGLEQNQSLWTTKTNKFDKHSGDDDDSTDEVNEMDVSDDTDSTGMRYRFNEMFKAVEEVVKSDYS